MTDVTFEEFMKNGNALLKDIAEKRKEIDEKGAQVEAMRVKQSERLAVQRRNGECGRAWQVLQQRIDLGETTERDVYSGVDDSPEAQQARKDIQAHIDELKHRLQDEPWYKDLDE